MTRDEIPNIISLSAVSEAPDERREGLGNRLRSGKVRRSLSVADIDPRTILERFAYPFSKGALADYITSSSGLFSTSPIEQAVQPQSVSVPPLRLFAAWLAR